MAFFSEATVADWQGAPPPELDFEQAEKKITEIKAAVNSCFTIIVFL